MNLVLAGCAVVFFSMLAFWRYNAVMFMLGSGHIVGSLQYGVPGVCPAVYILEETS